MTFQYKWGLSLSVLIVFFIAGWTTQRQNLVKWEYNAIHIERGGQVPSKYNELGEQGWELVNVNTDGWAYFKRQKK